MRSLLAPGGPRPLAISAWFARARYFSLTEMVSTRSWLSKIRKDVFRFPRLLTQALRPICQPGPAGARHYSWRRIWVKLSDLSRRPSANHLRLIREARAMYDSVFPPVKFGQQAARRCANSPFGQRNLDSSGRQSFVVINNVAVLDSRPIGAIAMSIRSMLFAAAFGIASLAAAPC